MNQNVSITGSGNSVMVSGGGDMCINVNGHGLRLTPLTEQPTFRMLRVALIDGGKELWVGNLIQQFNLADAEVRWVAVDLTPESEAFTTQAEALCWLLGRP